MLNLILQEAAKLFGSKATEDIGATGDAIASGDVKKMAGTAWDTFAPLPAQLATYSPEAQAMFGGAGRQDLILTRGLGIESFLRRLADSNRYIFRKSSGASPDTPKLISPSLAVHSIYDVNEFANDGLELVFKPSYFDPANTARAKLYNRDAYTYNSPKSGLEEIGWHGKKKFFDPRLTEASVSNSYTTMPDSELASILTSPEFKSFAAYEADKRGAGALDSYYTTMVGNFRRSLDRLLEKEFNFKQAKRDTVIYKDNYVAKINEKLSNPQNSLQERIVQLASQAPAGYAELKMRGHVPLNSSTLLGIIAHNKLQPVYKEVIKQALPEVPIIESANIHKNTRLTRKDAITELLERINGHRSTLTASKK